MRMRWAAVQGPIVARRLLTYSSIIEPQPCHLHFMVSQFIIYSADNACVADKEHWVNLEQQFGLFTPMLPYSCFYLGLYLS
jgi:hypothetical protein